MFRVVSGKKGGGKNIVCCSAFLILSFNTIVSVANNERKKSVNFFCVE